MIGIIGAMEKEIGLLRKQMANMEEHKIGVIRFYQGMLWGREVCLALCGIGKIHAALCAQAMILHFKPECIINIGVAGALDGVELDSFWGSSVDVAAHAVRNEAVIVAVD